MFPLILTVLSRMIMRGGGGGGGYYNPYEGLEVSGGTFLCLGVVPWTLRVAPLGSGFRV